MLNSHRGNLHTPPRTSRDRFEPQAVAVADAQEANMDGHGMHLADVDDLQRIDEAEHGVDGLLIEIDRRMSEASHHRDAAMSHARQEARCMSAARDLFQQVARLRRESEDHRSAIRDRSAPQLDGHRFVSGVLEEQRGGSGGRAREARPRRQITIRDQRDSDILLDS